MAPEHRYFTFFPASRAERRAGREYILAALPDFLKKKPSRWRAYDIFTINRPGSYAALQNGSGDQFAQRLRFDLTDTFAGNVELLPTSSSVWSVFISIPKRIRKLSLHARSGQPARRALPHAGFGGRRIQRQLEGGILDEIPQCESSSSPIGVSMEIGSLAISALCGSCLPASACVQPVLPAWFTAHLLQHLARNTVELVDSSIICTGIRMVRA